MDASEDLKEYIRYASYDEIKQKLTPDLVLTSENETLLTLIPHYELADLSVIIRIRYREAADSLDSLVVSDDFLRVHNVSAEQVINDALDNANGFFPPIIRSFFDIFPWMRDYDGHGFNTAHAMYTASLGNGIRGAGVIAYPGFMDQMAEAIGGNFYLLPSSVHEVIAIKEDFDPLGTDLEAIVVEVNHSIVAYKDRLSDSAYHYDCRIKKFELLDEYRRRLEANKNLSVFICGKN